MGGVGGFGGGFGGGGMDMEDIFFYFGDIFGGGFGGFGGGGCLRGLGCRVNKGFNFRVKVKLIFVDIVNGVEKKIKVKK